jgi:hypothetical protein
MLGMNLGVSIVPYFASLLWTWYVGPMAIFDVGIITMLACVPILFIAPRVSYLQSIPYIGLVTSEPRMHLYTTVADVEIGDLSADCHSNSSGHDTKTTFNDSYQQGNHVSP